jgi:LPXTG-motif cell wall-anchored protein
MTAKKLIAVPAITLTLTVLGSVFATTTVYADECESNYGGGQTCIINKSFRIEKKVAKAGSDQDCDDISSGDYKDKVTGIHDSKKDICFKIKVTNTGELETDEMKMKDFLPDVLNNDNRDGDLTEEWDNFEPGKTKTFYIRVNVDKGEFDRDDQFEKCAVNKAEIRYKGKFEGSSTATVCYGSESEIKELPKTGSTNLPVLAGLGFGSILLGLVVKKGSKATLA